MSLNLFRRLGTMSYDASTMSNNMRLAYSADGTAVYTSMGPPTSSPSPSPTPTYNNPNGAGGGARNVGENNSMVAVTAGTNASGGEVVKRKRGRPRKYAPDVSMPQAVTSKTPPGQAAAQVGGFPSSALSPGKKPRGRPPGSLNKQQPALSGKPGVGFMPHILDIKAGEDVLAKLLWFSQNSSRALCVLSANGAVSNVTLQQSATTGGTVTYEGRFEILSLSGSFMASEIGGQCSRTGGLSVALSGAGGRVLGGNVAGLLTAASSVQVIVGSFIPSSRKQTRTGGTNEAEVVNAPANLLSGTSAGGSPSESSGGGLGSPLDHSNNSNPQGMANMPWR